LCGWVDGFLAVAIDDAMFVVVEVLEGFVLIALLSFVLALALLLLLLLLRFDSDLCRRRVSVLFCDACALSDIFKLLLVV
jgi:hypothetical protein